MVYYGDNAPQLAGSVIALAVIGYFVFGLRIYTRLHHGAWGVDDWCMSAAIVSSFGSFLRESLTNDIDTLHSINGRMYRRRIQWSWHSQRSSEYKGEGVGDAGKITYVAKTNIYSHV
jgi:hypothetical protein